MALSNTQNMHTCKNCASSFPLPFSANHHPPTHTYTHARTLTSTLTPTHIPVACKKITTGSLLGPRTAPTASAAAEAIFVVPAARGLFASPAPPMLLVLLSASLLVLFPVVVLQLLSDVPGRSVQCVSCWCKNVYQADLYNAHHVGVILCTRSICACVAVVGLG